MKAMVLRSIASLDLVPRPLELVTLPDPVQGEGEILLEVLSCGVCHTELDEIEGRTPPPRLPVVPGHQVVGRAIATGPGADAFSVGDRVGVGWIYSACGACKRCRDGDENLCDAFVATGRDVDGGYAERMKVPEAFAHPIPDALGDAEAAPLLCAGAVGYRALRLTELEDGERLGLTGFGASAHLVLQLARHLYPRSEVFVFARSEREREFARELGAAWSGDTGERPPAALDAIIDTTPVWTPVLAALESLDAGGRLVINAIRKEDADRKELLRLDYATHLWRERTLKTVANVARTDIRDVLALAARIPIRPEVQEFRLEEANEAILDQE